MMKSIGLWRATSLVTGNMVGAGVLLLPVSIAAYGTIGLLGWGVTALGALALALVFCKLSTTIPKSGGPYAYAHEVFGDFVGFQMAWNYWISTWASNGALAVAFTSYVSSLFPEINQNPILAMSISLSAIWSLTYLNILGVKAAGSFQLVATIIKMAPLVLIGVVGFFFINPDNIVPLQTSEGHTSFGAVSAAAAVVLYAFIGLESATIPSASIIEPEKTIPRATLYGTLIGAGIYIWLNVVVLGIIPTEQLSQSHAPFADVFKVVFGKEFGVLMGVLGAFTCFSTLNGWILLQAQVPMAAAQDGLFPKFFAKQSEREVPLLGLIFSSVLITIMLYMNYGVGLVEQFTFIITLTTFSMLLPYFFSSLAHIVLLFKGKLVGVSKAQLLTHILIGVSALGYSAWAISSVGLKIILWGFSLAIIGIPFYIYMKIANKR